MQSRWLEQDLVAARMTQRMFLPPRERQDGERVKVVTEYRPAYHVGGDFYDVIHHDEEHACFIIGDVSGKGVSAALWMARFINEFREHARNRLPPSAILDAVDDWSDGVELDGRFVTAACVELDLRAREWRAAVAGHVPPMLVRRDGAFHFLREGMGPPLAVGRHFGGRGYREMIVPCQPQDMLVLVTDGLCGDGGGVVDHCGAILTDLPVRPTGHGSALGVIRSRFFAHVTSDDATFLGVELVR